MPVMLEANCRLCSIVQDQKLQTQLFRDLKCVRPFLICIYEKVYMKLRTTYSILMVHTSLKKGECKGQRLDLHDCNQKIWWVCVLVHHAERPSGLCQCLIGMGTHYFEVGMRVAVPQHYLMLVGASMHSGQFVKFIVFLSWKEETSTDRMQLTM